MMTPMTLTYWLGAARTSHQTLLRRDGVYPLLSWRDLQPTPEPTLNWRDGLWLMVVATLLPLLILSV